MESLRPVWAEISLDAIRNNISSLQSLLKPKTKFCAIIKANAYGHGAIAVAQVAEECGADYLGVALLSEAIELRKANVTLPILILGYTPKEMSDEVVSHSITQTVFSIEQVKALSQSAQKQGKCVKVHVKIETGMNRIGVAYENAVAFCSEVRDLPNVELEGVFTHFATADSADKAYATKQLSRFTSVLNALSNANIAIPVKHCANSAATIDLPQSHFDMVRAGIALYGIWPSDEVKKCINLQNVMKLKARVSMVKKVASGESISYGGLFKTSRESVIATLPLGYADGYSRLLTGKAYGVVNGRKVPVVGRICMDQCMIDITEAGEVQEGSEVLLFGDPDLPVSVIASLLGTIGYEIVCMISYRVPRIYV